MFSQNQKTKIPKYLQKRKIELTRQRIIKRKYGYLYYRKAVSKILPSLAKKYYENHLKKKSFRKLALHWYERRINWKLTLRADLHYNVVLKQRVFITWSKYVIISRTKRLKQNLADMMFEKNRNKITLRYSFSKWLAYYNYRLEKNAKRALAVQFYKLKYKPEYIKCYFARWKIYNKFCQKIKIKLRRAMDFYNFKLQNITFGKLKQYVSRRCSKRQKVTLADKHFEQKLMKCYMEKIIAYWNFKKTRHQLTYIASSFYHTKLLSWSFHRLLNNQKRNQNIRSILAMHVNRKEVNLKKNCFQKIKSYTVHRKNKLVQIEKAKMFHEIKVKEKCIKKLKIYCHKRKYKKHNAYLTLQYVNKRMDLYKLTKSFYKWKSYVQKKRDTQFLITRLTNRHLRLLKQQYLKKWQAYLHYRKSKSTVKQSTVTFYELKLKQKSLIKWKWYYKEQIEFKVKMKHVKRLYRENIIKCFFIVIIKNWEMKRQENLKLSTARTKHTFQLAEKYFFIWKWKTVLKMEKLLEPMQSSFRTQCELKSMTEIGEFVWNPDCFLSPRIPNFLQF